MKNDSQVNCKWPKAVLMTGCGCLKFSLGSGVKKLSFSFSNCAENL